MRARVSCLAVAVACALAPLAALCAPPPGPEVGDPDSFGRNAKWIGLGQTISVLLGSACPPPSPDSRCIVVNPAPLTTNFDERDLGRFTVPGRSTHSFMCHILSPIWFYHLSNPTAGSELSLWRVSAYVTIENDVLNEPGLINPSTGLPYGGSFETILPGSVSQSRTLAPGDIESGRDVYSRTCIAGILSRRAMRESMGLSDAQITRFFNNPTTFRLHISGSGRLVDSATLLYGLRLMGD